MQVLVHGTTYQQKRCPKCKALLEFSKVDIITHNTKRDDGTFILEWDLIKCLDCGNNIILDERKIEI